MGYLEDLTVRLARGASELESSLRERHGQWLLQRQHADGGWAGREGDPDAYYTSFAARALMILGLLDGPPAERLADYYRSQLDKQIGAVDFVSLLLGIRVLDIASGIDVLRGVRQDWKSSVAVWLESFRRPDGGYSKSATGHASSTYQTFLALLAYQILERSPPDRDAIVAFLRRHEQPEGGFLEIRVGKRAGVNPTAAALAALRMLDAIDSTSDETTAQFLAELQNDEGGWTANTRIPLADVLSTFTALVTLADLRRTDWIRLPAARQYILSMQRDAGGWAGFALDPAQDVEYTFYGLGGLALIQDLSTVDAPSEPA